MGETLPVTTDMDTFTIREPLGVVAGITPFNFPAMIPLWIFPLAIACGNTCVLKPSERDPGAAMILGEPQMRSFITVYVAKDFLRFEAKLAEEAGIPKGVLNVGTWNLDMFVSVHQSTDTKILQTSSWQHRHSKLYMR